MDLFYSLVQKIIPLYLLIGLGYFSAVSLKVPKEPIATLLIYILSTVVVFYGTYTANWNPAMFSLPLVFLFLCCLLALLFLVIGRRWMGSDSTKNILAFSAGTGNTGYFGIPVALVVFGEDSFSIVVLSTLGIILYENTLGFFLTAKGNHTARESLIKVIKLPAVYAFLAGLALNYSGVNIAMESFITPFKGAYTLLGMMIIGMALSTVGIKHLDYKFLFLCLIAKFIAWPLAMLALLWLDNQTFQTYNSYTQKVLLLLAIVPMAANTVAFASELRVHPDKAALVVLISTLIALIYIPLIMAFFAT